jgi:hypothetical protein
MSKPSEEQLDLNPQPLENELADEVGNDFAITNARVAWETLRGSRNTVLSGVTVCNAV